MNAEVEMIRVRSRRTGPLLSQDEADFGADPNCAQDVAVLIAQVKRDAVAYDD